MNKFYDLIIAKHQEYIQYDEFLEKQKMIFKDRRKEILKKIMEKNSGEEKPEVTPEDQNTLFDLQVEEKLYGQDAQMLFYNLYKMVETYLQLPDMVVLPPEITELCTELEYMVPKTMFVINAKGVAEEREKGSLKKALNPWYKDQQVKSFMDGILEQIPKMTQ